MKKANLIARKIFSIFPGYILHKIKKEITYVENSKSGEAREYYGQFDQDKWIIEDIFNFKKGGFFLDLAAGDGVNISNTYILEKKYGWKGICIEANNTFFKKLKFNRNCICINACIDDSEKKVKFTKASRGIIGGIIDESTDNSNLVDSNAFDYKRTVPLVKILEKNNAPKIIDYFSLDVEGVEYRILKNFPFNKYKFLAMNIERPNKKLSELLKKNGYIKVGSNFADALFINKDFLKLTSK